MADIFQEIEGSDGYLRKYCGTLLTEGGQDITKYATLRSKNTILINVNKFKTENNTLP